MNSLHRDLNKLIKQTEAAAKNSDSDNWRPDFHLSPPIGWLNDPNGLCQFNGVYHMFFQYSPFDAEGGLKFWGHSTSKNLLDWEYQGTALFPDQTFDCHGVYSGSALTDDGTLDIFYTGNVKECGDFDYINEGRQGNTVLISSPDGKNFGNKKCLMMNTDYPEDCTCHIRDPKVWKDANHYYMLLGARRRDDKGEILLFKSSDKENWRLLNRISTPYPSGYMWECPDLFTIGEQTYLSVSPQGIEQEEFRFQNLYQSGYFPLTGDYKADYELGVFEEWDYGFDFYAPQTFQDESGRRILIAWMGMPDMTEFKNPTVSRGWQHCMTLPRELVLRDGKILQIPIKETDTLFEGKSRLPLNKKIACSYGWKIEIANEQNDDFTVILSDELLISYTANTQTVAMEFKGEAGAGRTTRRMKLYSCSDLTILSDYSCIECFFNEGERVMSTRFYPNAPHTISILGHVIASYRCRKDAENLAAFSK